MEWYAAYADRYAADDAEGRLVSTYTFSESWTSWEMHLYGDEAVICTAGETTLRAGEYAINPRGAWHTANAIDSCTAMFITGGTEHRSR